MEAAVKIVTHKVIHALEGHQCVDLDELNGKIVGLVDAINTSVPFRSQQSSRRDLFEAHEQHLHADMPTTPWQHTEWKRAKVAPDFHITVSTVRYSVPHQLVGRTVDVRITGQVLTVFDQGTTVATHRVSHKRGAYVTDYEHIPSGMDSTRGLWTSDYFYREARKVGPVTRKVIGRRECLMQRLKKWLHSLATRRRPAEEKHASLSSSNGGQRCTCGEGTSKGNKRARTG